MGKLVWLASYPKSGNTWVRMFIAAYQSNAARLELQSAKEFSKSESLLADFAKVADKPIEELTQEDIDSHRLAVQEYLTTVVGQRVLKTHNARLDQQQRRLIFSRHTRAGIYVVRNPLDVVDSLSDHTNKSIDETIRLLNRPGHRLRATEQHAAQYVGTWSHHVRSWLDNHDEFPVLLLRYEDLVATPHEWFARLVQFLGWDYDPDRVQRAVELTAFESLQRAEAKEGFAETSSVAKGGRFFRHGAVGRWRDVLSHDQAAQVIKDHGAVMELAGYEIPDLGAAGQCSPTGEDTNATA